MKCIYIDPPYNTGNDEFIYKNGYQHSSWATLIHNRLTLAKPLLSRAGVIFQSIDDNEQTNLKLITNDIFGEENFINTLVIKRSANGIGSKDGYSINHDYILVSSNNPNAKNRFFGTYPSLDYKQKFNKKDEFGLYKIDGIFRKKGAGSRKEDSPGCFYPLYYNPKTGRVFLEKQENLSVALPYLPSGNYSRWIWGKDFAKTRLHRLYASESGTIYVKDYWDDLLREKPRSILEKNEYLTDTATNEIVKLFGNKNFSTPKPFNLIKGLADNSIQNTDIIIDYFAGSGTTAHAVISLNREDGGKRKYILVEQGEYFDTVLKPRVQKVIYSENWKDGKPQADKDGDLHGVPQIVKVLQLESYEDTLNNLSLNRQDDVFNRLSETVQEDYLLRYMLTHESRDSLLSTDDFKHPFAYRLNIATSSAGSYESRVIDLVETFNYLLGISVQAVDDQRHDPRRQFVFIEGELPNGEDCLIIWRDCERWDYQQLPELLKKRRINPNKHEFDVIYINGDHNIPTVLQEADGIKTLKLRPIEPEFLSLMFDVEDM